MPADRCSSFELLYAHPPDIDVGGLPAWCWGIALNVCDHYQLEGRANLEDLQSLGVVRSLELLARFSPEWPRGYAAPDAAFRGWAYREVLTALQREAARILGGGTFRSPRREKGRSFAVARPISDLEEESDDPRSPFQIADPHEPEYDWEDDPFVLCHAPGTSTR